MKFDYQETLEILRRTPFILNQQLEGLSETWTEPDYGSGTWSVHQILGHLIWGERTDWVPRVRHILEYGNSKPFTPFDREGHSELCEQTSTPQLLKMFQEERKENLESLQQLSLTEEDFQKVGVHPTFGEITMSHMLSSWTVHDLNHIAQINKAMAYQYYDSVGPWTEFLSILAPPNPK